MNGRLPKILVFAIGCLTFASSAVAQQDRLASQMEGLRQADLRLAGVLFHLASANDELCQKHGPLTGLVLHASAAYDEAIRPSVIRYFHFESPLAVEAVVAGSPAARAGVLPDDSILAIDGAPLGHDETRDEALASIDARGANHSITLTLARAEQKQAITIIPARGCLAHAETVVNDDLNAATDGSIIQVDAGLINLIGGDDQALAAIVAHELAHVVLDHPQRLTAAHVDRGLFKGFGRSARLFKQTENEADRLSVTLMANAGYDPKAAVRYWLTYGPQIDKGRGLGSTHLSWRKRAALIDQEVHRVAEEHRRPIVPDWLASRDQPLR
jgi:hypothetical protein